MEGDDGLTNSQLTNYGEWYPEVITTSQLIWAVMPVSYILMPWAAHIWNVMKARYVLYHIRWIKFYPEYWLLCFMRALFNREIKTMGVEPSAIPTLMPNDAVQDETDIINDFDLQAPSAINPTSEALFYRHFSTLIKIHTNLPLMLYHWLHAIQLECSNPNPLISQGFLCQEGHTTFATKEEAKTEVLAIIEPYRCLCKDYLVVPVLIGTKSEMEKFANGLYTASVEAFISSTGRGVQAAIAHYLGQSLANWYHINFEDKNGETAMVWHNSWAFTTRMIGVMVMVMPHGDDKSIHIEGTK